MDNASNKKPFSGIRAVAKPLLALIFVLLLALVLLMYIASVDASLSYSGFLLDHVYSSAEIIERTIESLLLGGLTLPQLVGFDNITQPIISADDTIYHIAIVDQENMILFENAKEGYESALFDSYDPYALSSSSIEYDSYRNDDSLQVRLPLDGRFDQPGTLLVTMPTFVVSQFINRNLLFVGIFAFAVIFAYALILLFLLNKRSATTLGVNLVYNISFVAVAMFLTVSLIFIYSNGVQQKAQSLANSLSVRIGAIFDLGLTIDNIAGIEEEFIDYKQLNPDIEFVSLTKDDIIIVHTDPERISEVYARTPNTIEYREDIRADLGVAISVAIPRRIVFRRLIRNIKNFAVLFFASAFLSWLLLRILFSIYPDISSDLASSVLPQSHELQRSRALLDLIFPAFFLANFVEGLHYSYLPQFMSQLAVEAGFAEGRVGGVYALFWAMYALVLIPAGRSARTLEGIRRLLVTGFIFISSSMLLLIFLQHFTWLYLIRSIAGLGQGMVFIAVQSYILQQSNENQRTEGVSIIVYGYNGGVISGTVIGALLVSSLGINPLLLISAIVAISMVWYSASIVGQSRRRKIAGDEDIKLHAPSAETRQTLYTYGSGGGLSLRQGFGRRLKLLFTDFEFTKTILLIGLITKAVLAGVAFLALPHFLAKLDYRQEDIGQIIMFYAAGVLLVSRLVARYTDRIGNTKRILFFGSMSSAVGLAIIASAQSVALLTRLPAFQTITLIFGILILGLAHGFIHAPIVTHITRAPVSAVLGRTVVASIYRFMERIGHILGPLIFGYFLFQEQAQISAIYYIAIIVGVLGLLFYFLPSSKKDNAF